MTQPTIEQIDARIADIHGRNIAAGWWTDLTTGESLKGKRPALELLALVHSELSEGLEGLRKNLPDDKLPHRPMIEVELADAEIRLYDTMGGFNLVATKADFHFKEFERLVHSVERPSEALALLHLCVTGAVMSFLEPDMVDQQAAILTMCILALHAVADKFDYDLDGAREEKLAYNLTREDHKVEARRGAFGKQI